MNKSTLHSSQLLRSGSGSSSSGSSGNTTIHGYTGSTTSLYIGEPGLLESFFLRDAKDMSAVKRLNHLPGTGRSMDGQKHQPLPMGKPIRRRRATPDADRPIPAVAVGSAQHSSSSLPDIRSTTPRRKNDQQARAEEVKQTQPSSVGTQRRRVQFSPTVDQTKHLSSSITTVVRRKTWIDHKGLTGSYTGQVNEQMQPHGSGALVYENGIAKTRIWKNGMPVQHWKPKQTKTTPASPKVYKAGPSPHSSSSACNHTDTYLHHLDLGDNASPQDMLHEEPLQKDVDSLRVHDFVFLLRSNSQWTYAIVAGREDDSILFVVDTSGSTKSVSIKHWIDSIRLVNSDVKQKNCKLQHEGALLPPLPFGGSSPVSDVATPRPQDQESDCTNRLSVLSDSSLDILSLFG